MVYQHPLAWGVCGDPQAVWAEGMDQGQELAALVGMSGVTMGSRGRCRTAPEPGALLPGLPLRRVPRAHLQGLGQDPITGQ